MWGWFPLPRSVIKLDGALSCPALVKAGIQFAPEMKWSRVLKPAEQGTLLPVHPLLYQK
jgi:hypothetical protein